MDSIDSHGKDKSFKSSESKLHMRNVGNVCIFEEESCGGGRKIMTCYSNNDTKRNGADIKSPLPPPPWTMWGVRSELGKPSKEIFEFDQKLLHVLPRSTSKKILPLHS